MSINFVPSQFDRPLGRLRGECHRRRYCPDRGNWRVARDIFIADTNENARRLALDGVLARDWRDYFIPLLSKGKLLKATKIDPA